MIKSIAESRGSEVKELEVMADHVHPNQGATDGISCRDRKGSERDQREGVVRRASDPADNDPAAASMEPELLHWDGGACVCGSDSEVYQGSEVAEGRATCFLPPMNWGVSTGRIS